MSAGSRAISRRYGRSSLSTSRTCCSRSPTVQFMLVLLHAYNKGFTAMEVAVMFTLYELMGAVTNLAGVAGGNGAFAPR